MEVDVRTRLGAVVLAALVIGVLSVAIPRVLGLAIRQLQSTTQVLAPSPTTKPVEVYVAQLAPLNEQVSNQAATGKATFTVNGDYLTIKVEAEGLSPDTMHMQLIHGFINGMEAGCPRAYADGNNDGVVDSVETHPFSGVTLVPLHSDPVSLGILNETYPTATREGTIRYERTVSLSSLETALEARYGVWDLALERRAVVLYGVAPTAVLPQQVQSISGVPAQKTLPVACGEIDRVEPEGNTSSP